MKEKYCSKCGEKLVGKASFCSNCGEKVSNNTLKNDTKIKKNNSPKEFARSGGRVIRYVTGGVFVFFGLISFLDITSLRDEIPGVFLLLFGVSLMPFVYEKYLHKIKIKRISVFLPIIFIFCFICSVPSNIEDDGTLDVDKMTFLEFNWPSSSFAKLLPVPKSSIGYIDWENESGFVIYVSKTTIDDYKEYVKACEEKGFTVEINKGEDYYWAKDKNNYSLHVDYEGKEVMFIRIDVPKSDKTDTTSNEKSSASNDKKNTTNQQYYNLSIISDSTLKNNFITACKEIKMDPDKIESVFKKHDWSNGPRYKFTYEGKKFLLYAYDNGNVRSITLEDGNIMIYLEGFEPYNVNDFLSKDGTIPKVDEKKRKEINQNTTSTQKSNEIIIKDGQKGTYGKEDLFDGEKYIRYYVPTGKYEVEALVKNADFYIESKKIYKEDGWDTSTVIREVKLPTMGDTTTIEIKSDQCISLVIHSQIKLTKTK